MKIGDFKRFDYGVTVLCNSCDYYDVYMIDIDDDRIELSDTFGMVIGTINTNQVNNCEVVNYNNDGGIIGLKDL